jgi:hypothetical protein
MSKQSVVVRSQRNGRKFVAALVLAAALTGLPLLAANVPGPLSTFFVQQAYACPVGGTCG